MPCKTQLHSMSSSSSSDPAPKAKKPRATKSKAAPKTKYSDENKDGLVYSKYGNWYKPRPKPPVYSDTASFKKSYKTLAPEAQELIDMVLDPDTAKQGVRWPNTYGLSSTFKSINTINAQYDDEQKSLVVVYPRLTNSIFSTAGSEFPFNLTKTGALAGNYCSQEVQTGTNTARIVDITAPFYINGGRVVLPIPISYAGSVHYLYPIACDAVAPNGEAPYVQFVMSNITPGNVDQFTCTVTTYSGVLNIIDSNSVALGASGAAQVPFDEFAHGSASQYLSFRITSQQPYSYVGSVALDLRNNTAHGPANFPMKILNKDVNCIASDLDGAKLVTTTAEEYFCLAQSLLVTYRGSTLENGGLIATARVPASTNTIGAKSDASADLAAGGSQYYNWISSLQNNRYDGPLKTGAYTFFLGDDESDYFYRDTEDQRSDLPYMVAAFSSSTADAENNIRIKVITHIQYKSNSNVFAQSISPYMKDSRLLPHILSLVPSSYCNMMHKKEIGEYLKSIGKQVGKALASPKTWMTVAELVALLA